MAKLLYAERDIEILDARNGHYSRHVSAMTAEGLQSKSAIAAELAYRDQQIDELINALAELQERYDLDVNPEGK